MFLFSRGVTNRLRWSFSVIQAVGCLARCGCRLAIGCYSLLQFVYGTQVDIDIFKKTTKTRGVRHFQHGPASLTTCLQRMAGDSLDAAAWCSKLSWMYLGSAE